MLTVPAGLNHNHSANAYFVNPGCHHSGVCRNDDAVALISYAIIVMEYAVRIILIA